MVTTESSSVKVGGGVAGSRLGLEVLATEYGQVYTHLEMSPLGKSSGAANEARLTDGQSGACSDLPSPFFDG
jgi:hypothetical protein